jgi:hypothetical protein
VPVFWGIPVPGSAHVAPISNRSIESSPRAVPVVALGLELSIGGEKLRIWRGRRDLNAHFDPLCTRPSHSGVATGSPVAGRALAPAFALASSSLEKKKGDEFASHDRDGFVKSVNDLTFE